MNPVEKQRIEDDRWMEALRLGQERADRLGIRLRDPEEFQVQRLYKRRLDLECLIEEDGYPIEVYEGYIDEMASIDIQLTDTYNTIVRDQLGSYFQPDGNQIV